MNNMNMNNEIQNGDISYYTVAYDCDCPAGKGEVSHGSY